MMGNNLQALNTARSISKQLATNRQHRPKTSNRNNAVNLTGKTVNSESVGSVHGVTRHTQLPSAAQTSGYLKESNNGLPVMSDERKYVDLTRVADNTRGDLNDDSFIYHNLGKLSTGTQEIKPDKSRCEAGKDKGTVCDKSTKSVDNKKHPVIVDLTLDDSDDDADSGCDVKGTVEDTGSTSVNISGTRGIVNGVCSGAGVTDGGDDRVGVSSIGRGREVVGMSDGISGAGSVVGVSSQAGVTDGGDDRVGVSSKGRGRKVVGMSDGISGAGSVVGVSSQAGVTEGGDDRVGVSSEGNGREVVGMSDGISGAGSVVGVSSQTGVTDVGGDKVGVCSNGYDRRVGNVCTSTEVSLTGATSGDRVGVGSGYRQAGLSGVGTVGHVANENTLPKILASYSLNNSGLRNLLHQKSKENVVKPNVVVVNGTATIPIGPNPGMVKEAPRKNGFTIQPNYDASHQPTFESIAYNNNDVKNDVTNLCNGSSAKKLDPTQKVFSWSVRHDSNLDSVRRDQGGVATPMDTEDQVIITKVVTSAERSHGRKHHPRKAPVEVRKLFLEEKSEQAVSSAVSERDVLKKRRKINNTKDRHDKRTLEETIASLNGTINGTPWSFTMKPDICYRENKIRDLKQRLAMQEEAVEKLRSKDKDVSMQVNGVNRVLVVQIPDLKSKLGIQSEKKQSFRVFDQKDTDSTNGEANKRKRKALPKKVSRAADYDSDHTSYPSHKRTRFRREKIRQRLPRRPRSANSKAKQVVPVVSKDLWHREMEKVEAELASSNRPMDQTAFLLFLGLKKVEAM